ncbi:hypothetical protein [Pseudochrobactrum sp. MP213Fo]|uniref:hypothetical protein n=1 Tax=Pseudochrobactrum sp. MP213Fo TaxID=3022250 RepID=UPI003B9E9904
MFKVSMGLCAIMALSACTSTEKDLSVGTVAGAAIGGIAGGTSGAAIGAAAGAGGGLLVRTLRNGNCEYRDNRGNIYTSSCRR